MTDGPFLISSFFLFASPSFKPYTLYYENRDQRVPSICFKSFRISLGLHIYSLTCTHSITLACLFHLFFPCVHQPPAPFQSIPFVPKTASPFFFNSVTITAFQVGPDTCHSLLRHTREPSHMALRSLSTEGPLGDLTMKNFFVIICGR